MKLRMQFTLDVDAGVIDELVAAFKRCSIFRVMDMGDALTGNIYP